MNFSRQYTIKNYKNEPRPNLNDDFYGHINHDWFQENDIPDDEVRYTHFIQTQLDINNKLKKILESNVFPLATTLYKSYLDDKYKEQNGLNDLKQIIGLVDNMKTYEDLIIVATKLIFINVSTIFSFGIDVNTHSSCNYCLYMGQPSLGLPDRSYYFESKHKDIRQKYYDTICQINKELNPGSTDAKLNNITKLILDIETKFAVIFLNTTDRRNIEEIVNQLTYKEAKEKYPKLRVDLIIKTLCQVCEGKVIEENFETMIFENHNDETKNYFIQLQTLLAGYTIEEWKEYYKYRITLSYMNLTNSKMREIYFNFFKKTLKGQKTQKPIWKSAMNLACSLFNDNISRIYSHNYFTKEKDKYVNEMVKYIKIATKERISKLDWMSDQTKKKALLKLHRMKLKIGYSKSAPRDFDHIILSNSVIKNCVIINIDSMIYTLNKLNNTVDPDDWSGTQSYIVNAYFNPTRNEIIFPAAILQSPFLDLKKSDIYNYGNLGGVIGHEIIHGFDDQGSKFDDKGNIHDWWTEIDKKNYQNRVNQIIKAYDDQGINGSLTVGENIADFGAVDMPLNALSLKFKRQLVNKEIREFYISFATHWQYLLRPEVIEERMLSDPHAFADLRVNIPLANQKLFQSVFNIKPGDKMYINPKDMISIW